MSLPGWTQLIQVIDVTAARRALAARLLHCPDCAAPLRPWGHATARTIHDLHGAAVTARPDRARCTGCGATHVVLDAALLARRGYTAQVIGHALLGVARGQTHRAIAEQVDVPCDTVRGWIRCARRTGHHLWTLAVQAVVALDQHALPERGWPDTLTAAVDVLARAAHLAQQRLGPAFARPWSAITVLTRGQLLTPVPAD